MFELAVARKYILPRVRQFSVSCISIISILVIALVVWLSIVFFSAQEGIERRWTEKLIALTAPVRLTPTDSYFQSYYYQIDAYSSRSGFSYKSLSEKFKNDVPDPFDPENDPSLPKGFAKFDGVDIIKETMAGIKTLKLKPAIFETAYATVTVYKPDFRITQVSYVMAVDESNPLFLKSLIPPYTDIHDPHAILLPKSYLDAHAAIGDSVILSTQGFGVTSASTIRLEGHVAGFYDPGIIPVGGKIVLAPESLVKTLSGATIGEEQLLPSGINVHGCSLTEASRAKDEIVHFLKEKGLDTYWKVETFREYEFTKEIFQQMSSDKNLFLLIACIIIFVASSNIVSMLIILVRDKKKEIAILQALGATKKSIATIFGLCGFWMGIMGALLGSLFAWVTIKNLDLLLALLGRLQGFDVLNKAFYGESLSTDISVFAVLFVLALSCVASTFAGITASLAACRINCSDALRNE